MLPGPKIEPNRQTSHRLFIIDVCTAGRGRGRLLEWFLWWMTLWLGWSGWSPTRAARS